MLRALRASAIFHPCVELLSAAGTVLVVFFGGLLAHKGTLTVEDIVAFLLYLGLFYAPVSGLANLLEHGMSIAPRGALNLSHPSYVELLRYIEENF